MESTDAPQKKSARKSSAEIPAAEGTEEAPAKPRRGRPRKKPVEEVPETAGSPDVPVTEAPVKPVRRRSAKTIAPEDDAAEGAKTDAAVSMAPAEPAASPCLLYTSLVLVFFVRCLFHKTEKRKRSISKPASLS